MSRIEFYTQFDQKHFCFAHIFYNVSLLLLKGEKCKCFLSDVKLKLWIQPQMAAPCD
jgi:hypothetical protein